MKNVISINVKADNSASARFLRLENERKLCEQRKVIMELERRIDHHERQEAIYMELSEEAPDFASRRAAANFVREETKIINELLTELQIYLAITGL